MTKLEEELSFLKSMADFDRIEQGISPQQASQGPDRAWFFDVNPWQKIIDKALDDGHWLRHPKMPRTPTRVDVDSPYVQVQFTGPGAHDAAFIRATCPVCEGVFALTGIREEVLSFCLPKHPNDEPDDPSTFQYKGNCSGSGMMAGHGISNCHHCRTLNYGSFTKKGRLEFVCKRCDTPNSYHIKPKNAWPTNIAEGQ